MEMKIFKVDSHTMEKESLIETPILKFLFTCYLGNDHYCTCTCYLNMKII